MEDLVEILRDPRRQRSERHPITLTEKLTALLQDSDDSDDSDENEDNEDDEDVEEFEECDDCEDHEDCEERSCQPFAGNSSSSSAYQEDSNSELKLVRTTWKQSLPLCGTQPLEHTTEHTGDPSTLSKDVTYVPMPKPLKPERSEMTYSYIPVLKPPEGRSSNKPLEELMDEVLARADCRDGAVPARPTATQGPLPALEKAVRLTASA